MEAPIGFPSPSRLDKKIQMGMAKDLPLVDKIIETVLDHCVDSIVSNLLASNTKIDHIDELSGGEAAAIDDFVRKITLTFVPESIKPIEITRLNADIDNRADIIVRFIYTLNRRLVSVFTHAALREQATNAMAVMARYTGAKAPAVKVDVPGWMGEPEANEYADSVYWMIPLTLLSFCSFSEYRVRLTKALEKAPWGPVAPADKSRR